MPLYWVLTCADSSSSRLFSSSESTSFCLVSSSSLFRASAFSSAWHTHKKITQSWWGHWNLDLPYFLSFLSAFSLFKVSQTRMHKNVIPSFKHTQIFWGCVFVSQTRSHSPVSVLAQLLPHIMHNLRLLSVFTEVTTHIFMIFTRTHPKLHKYIYFLFGLRCRGLYAGLSCCWLVHVPGRHSPAPNACLPLANDGSPAEWERESEKEEESRRDKLFIERKAD